MLIVQQVSFLVFLLSSFSVICFLFSFGFTIASVLHTFDDKETIPFCNRKFVAIYSILRFCVHTNHIGTVNDCF